jgi:endo-1,4-beta-xylanase
MKTAFKVLFYGILVLFILSFIACDTANSDDDDDDEGDVVTGDTIQLTVGDKRNLAGLLPDDFNGRTVNWSSSAANVATVSNSGLVQAVGITNRGSSAYTSGAGTGTATITASAAGTPVIDSYAFTINTTTGGLVNILALPPMKGSDQLGRHFQYVGNIFNPNDATSASGINNSQLTRHYNVLTMENNMKPSFLAGTLSGTTVTPNESNIAIAKRMIDAARASGISVVGHTLLWHSQNAGWITNLPAHNNNETTRQNNITIMKNYITAIAGNPAFKGRIYSWDVLNEVFPDGGYTNDWKTSIRPENPWFKAIGPDFIYEGFLAARFADPQAILYYNDYNTDMSSKASMIRNMVRDVNDKYKSLPSSQKPSGEKSGRLLIEGIGMQEHHNLSVQASSISSTITMFRALGVELAVSELDVLGNSNYNDFSNSTGQGAYKHTSSTVTNNQLITQASRFAEYMAVYIANKDIIKRITLWGVTDSNSWRSGGLPLLFDSTGKAKPAYYRFITAAQQ